MLSSSERQSSHRWHRKAWLPALRGDTIPPCRCLGHQHTMQMLDVRLSHESLQSQTTEKSELVARGLESSQQACENPQVLAGQVLLPKRKDPPLAWDPMSCPSRRPAAAALNNRQAAH